MSRMQARVRCSAAAGMAAGRLVASSSGFARDGSGWQTRRHASAFRTHGRQRFRTVGKVDALPGRATRSMRECPEIRWAYTSF